MPKFLEVTDAGAARTALGATTTGSAMFTAANAAAARTAIDAASSDDLTAKRYQQSVVAFGDSIVAQGYSTSDEGPRYDMRGFYAWANAFLGWRFDILNNAGISGDTLAAMNERIATDVLAYNPSWVWMDGGVNDINVGASYATVISRFQTIFNTLRENNIRVMCVTVTPSAAFDSGKNLIRGQVNQWLRKYGAENPNVVVVDTAPVLQNPASNSPLTAYAPDGLHPSSTGSMVMGWAVAEALKDITVPRSPLTAGTDPVNILGSGGMLTGSTDGLATLWTKSQSGSNSTYSKISRTDNILGERQRVITPAGANSAAIYLSTDPSTGFSVGDTIYGAVELALSNPDLTATSNQLRTFIQLSCINDSISVLASTVFGFDGNGSQSQLFPLNYSATLRTPNVVVPAGTTKLRFVLWGLGGATRDWSRAVVCKV
jgi:lysophospholipase L1-like esterase